MLNMSDMVVQENSKSQAQIDFFVRPLPITTTTMIVSRGDVGAKTILSAGSLVVVVVEVE